MGDAKKLRKSYSTPGHPWQKLRLDEEEELSKEFGLANKKELWKVVSKLTNFKDQVKKLTAIHTKQSEIEQQALLAKLKRIKLLSKTSTLGDVLGLSVRDLLERRLQTIVYRKNLAHSMKQARQFIIHRHIYLGDKKLTVPSYIVSEDEESLVRFSPNSSLADEEHPERKMPEHKPEEKKVLEDKKAKRTPVRRQANRRGRRPAERRGAKRETKPEKKGDKK